MESPLFIDIVLYAIYALLAAAVLLTAWSVVRSFRKCGGMGVQGRENGVPARRIILLTGGLLVVTLVVTWLTASSQPLNINGKTYDNAFWLRVSDMLICTALVLIAVVAASVAYAMIKSQITQLRSQDTK
ncbi:MAG: hypothetical protein K6B13_09985 [Prevotella sp.]|nr:hypothetical protein [Prevotella sp.]